MNDHEHPTQDKIVLAALALFFEQGIQKTSVEEVAYRAGVTRVTVYRYFGDKEALVRAAFVRSESVFHECAAALARDPAADWSQALDRLAEGLAALPSGPLSERLGELKRLYPAIYADFQAVRVAGLDAIFGQLIDAAEREGSLRPGLDRRLIRILFWDALVNIFDNPVFAGVGLSNVELFRIVKDTLLYGILVGEPDAEAARTQPRPERTSGDD